MCSWMHCQVLRLLFNITMLNWMHFCWICDLFQFVWSVEILIWMWPRVYVWRGRIMHVCKVFYWHLLHLSDHTSSVHSRMICSGIRPVLERQSSRKYCSKDDLNIRVFKFKINIRNMTDPNALSKRKPWSNKLAYANTQERPTLTQKRDQY